MQNAEGVHTDVLHTFTFCSAFADVAYLLDGFNLHLLLVGDGLLEG